MDGCEIDTETIDKLTRNLLGKKEDIVVRELGHLAFKIGGVFVDRHFWWAEECIDIYEFVGMIRFRPFRVEDNESSVEELYLLSLKHCGMRTHDGSSILLECTT